MRKTVKIGLVGLMLAVGAGRANAQLWVQNCNFALQAQVQVATNSVQSFAINSKAIIQYLRGISVTNSFDIVDVTTNAGLGVLRVTNSAFLPNAGHPTNAFPTNFVVSNYSVTIGSTNFTNHVSTNFNSDIELTQVPSEDDTNLVEYVFTNAVVLATNVTGFTTNATGFLFPSGWSGTAPNQILAFFETNAIGTNASAATNTVFSLVGVTITVTTTNQTGVTIPRTFVSKNPKLIVKSVADSEELSFFIRDGTTDYDVSFPFFNYNPHLHEVNQAKGNGFNDNLDISIDFDNQNGTTLQTEAAGKQVRGTVPKASGLFVKSVSATDVGGGSAAAPPAGQPLTGKPFPVGPTMVVSGKFTVNGGKIETQSNP